MKILKIILLFCSFGVSILSLASEEPIKNFNKFQISCDRMNNIFPAEVNGTIWYTGGGSSADGLLNIKIWNTDGTLAAEYKNVEISGIFHDELDYRLVDASVPDRSHPVMSVQFNDIQPSGSLIVLRDRSRWATNCVGGILE